MKQCIRVGVEIRDGYGKTEKFNGFWVDTLGGPAIRAVIVSDDFTVRSVPLESLTVQAKTFQLQSDREIYNTMAEN